jgi:hypothetical protein
MELDKDLIERFRAKFGISDMDSPEWVTNGEKVVGLPKPDSFLKFAYIPLGRFRLKKGIEREKKRTIFLFNRQGVKSILLFGAMTVVKRRRILELGLYKGHLVTVSNGEWMVVIAPLMKEEDTIPYDLNVSDLIDERDLDKYREATLWFKMLKGGE